MIDQNKRFFEGKWNSHYENSSWSKRWLLEYGQFPFPVCSSRESYGISSGPVLHLPGGFLLSYTTDFTVKMGLLVIYVTILKIWSFFPHSRRRDGLRLRTFKNLMRYFVWLRAGLCKSPINKLSRNLSTIKITFSQLKNLWAKRKFADYPIKPRSIILV